MESSDQPARVLVVANRTAATPALIAAVKERAERGPARFTLLVPNTSSGVERFADPEDHAETEAQNTLELALPLLEEAAGSEVTGMVGAPEPMDAIQDAVNLHGFDEIILSTLPKRVSRWLHLDLPSKLNVLGLPVTTVTASGRAERVEGLAARGRAQRAWPCPRSGQGLRPGPPASSPGIRLHPAMHARAHRRNP